MPTRTRASAATSVLDELLARRIVVVGGKGGTGKSTVAAALCMLGAKRGKRVLGIEVDAKGDLAGALGSAPVGFEPKVVQTGVSVLALHVEESLQEYLNVFFKVPKFTRLTPLARVFEFIASGVPGPKDMLVVGKIAWEERKRDRDGNHIWDLIVVDGTASGHLVGELSAPRSMHRLMQGGMVRQQTEWIEASITDPARTTMCITALPEEMPIVEALELETRAREEAGIDISAFFVNRAFPVTVTPKATELARSIAAHGDQLGERLHGNLDALVLATEMGRRLTERTTGCTRKLRLKTGVPVVEVPLLEEGRSGAAVTRAVAAAIQRRAS